MKSKEKGFKVIKIEDPSSDTQNNSFLDITNIKFLLCLIIIGTIILTFLVYKFFYLLSQAEQDSDYNRKNNNEKLKNYNLRNRNLNYTDTNITNYTNSNTINNIKNDKVINIFNYTNETNIIQNINNTYDNNIQMNNNTNINNNTQLDNHTINNSYENNSTQIAYHTNESNSITQNTNVNNKIEFDNNTLENNNTTQLNNQTIGNNITQTYNLNNENNNYTQIDNYTNEYNNIQIENNNTNTNKNISSYNLENITISENITDNITYKNIISKIYENYSFEEVKNPKISIIIIVKNDNNFNKNCETIIHILKNICEQNFSEIETLFVDDYIKKNNNSLIYEEIKKYDKRIKILEYDEKIGNFKKIINGVNHAIGEYLLFMDYSENSIFYDKNAFELMYNKFNETETDIIEFEPFPNINKILHQPELFDYMYFGQDDFNQRKLFSLERILIKRELFINITEIIDTYYKEQNINNYEEFMFIFLLTKKAQSFQYLRLKTDGNRARKLYTFIPNLKDFLLYMKFMMQYSGNNVPEKRMIAGIFMKQLIKRRNYLIEREDYNLTNEVIDIFVSCDKISDYEEKEMREFQKQNIKIYEI